MRLGSATGSPLACLKADSEGRQWKADCCDEALFKLAPLPLFCTSTSPATSHGFGAKIKGQDSFATAETGKPRFSGCGSCSWQPRLTTSKPCTPLRRCTTGAAPAPAAATRAQSGSCRHIGRTLCAHSTCRRYARCPARASWPCLAHAIAASVRCAVSWKGVSGWRQLLHSLEELLKGSYHTRVPETGKY